ncbi:ABC transporter permease [bacterium]|nr:ABC transporter permease [bacterium]
MTHYVIQRLIVAFITILGVTFLVFVAMRALPGSAIDVITSTSTVGGENARHEIEHRLGLDEPIPIGYAKWLGDIARGDLGTSIISGQSISRYIREGLPVTLELGLMSLFFGIVFGIPIGIISAVKQDTPIDYALRSLAITLLSVPGFLIAVVVLVLASKFWNWAPPITYIKFTDDPIHNLGQFALPAIILGFSSSAALMRFTRTAVLDVYREDYVRTARAKGMAERVVVMRHVVRNSMIPIVTIIGLSLAYIIGGTVIFEQLFQLPGLGRFILSEINTRDYPGVQDISILFATVVVLVNLATDLVYTLIDPRVTY